MGVIPGSVMILAVSDCQIATVLPVNLLRDEIMKVKPKPMIRRTPDE